MGLGLRMGLPGYLGSRVYDSGAARYESGFLVEGSRGAWGCRV